MPELIIHEGCWSKHSIKTRLPTSYPNQSPENWTKYLETEARYRVEPDTDHELQGMNERVSLASLYREVDGRCRKGG